MILWKECMEVATKVSAREPIVMNVPVSWWQQHPIVYETFSKGPKKRDEGDLKNSVAR